MAVDRRFLEVHGRSWRVQVAVPDKLHKVMGKQRLVRSLRTDSLALANRLRWPVVAEFKAAIAKAERDLLRKTSADPLDIEALQWREQTLESLRSPGGAIYDEDGELLEDTASLAITLIEDRMNEVRERFGPEKAHAFYEIATGGTTPTPILIDEWLAEAIMKPRQKLDYRRAVAKFDDWLEDGKYAKAVGGVTRKLAGRYVSDTFVHKQVHAKTANKDISCLSSFWRWLERRGHVGENVWSRQSLPVPRVPKSERKRPYRDDEVKALLAGGASALLQDAMTIAALSGMRVEEIARLKVRDIAEGCMEVREAKSASGEREVPIHPGILPIIVRRCTGKKAEEFLFAELPTPPPTSATERSQRVSKAFTAYRRRLGIDEVPPGARQSRIDFHSFRRWFLLKARDALQAGTTGFCAYTMAEVVGHSKDVMPLGLTMSRYPGDTSNEAKRACVEAVRLPI